jgi:DNA polymerase-3 subunit alpha (Gram-positive type)
MAQENQFIIDKINSTAFELITIKLTGPYFQGLIEMFSFFSKLPDYQQNEIIEKLYHFNDLKNQGGALMPAPADFIIMNHLIPEQFIIFPLESLHQKLELVFRYPTHQNKLIQFLNTKSSRIMQKKLKNDILPIPAKNFIYIYLIQKNPCLLISKINQKFTNIDFKQSMDSFILEHPNNYQFPQHYL